MAETIGLRILKAAAERLAGEAKGPHLKPEGLSVDRQSTVAAGLGDLPRSVVCLGKPNGDAMVETVEDLCFGGAVLRTTYITVIHQVAGSNDPETPSPDDLLDPFTVWGTQQMTWQDRDGSGRPLGTYFGGLARDVSEVGFDREYQQATLPQLGGPQVFRVEYMTAAGDPTAPPDWS